MNKTQRIPFLDAARAFAACLGIFLHSAVGYLQNPVSEWPRYSDKASIFFDYFVYAIHVFRLPIFFFLAGYFMYHAIRRLQLWGFIKNRTKRIVLPFLLVSFFLYYPTILFNLLVGRIHSVQSLLLLFHSASHLWFLEYLIIYYGAFLLFVFLLIRSVSLQNMIERGVNAWVASKWFFLPIVLINFLYLYLARAWYIPTVLNFVPNIWQMSIYGSFFLLGILLSKMPNFDTLFTFKWRTLFFAVISFSLYLFLFKKFHTETARIVIITFYSFAMYFAFKAFLSCCYTFFNKSNAWLIYLADASYWIYLSQIFLVFWVHHFTAKYFDSIFSQFVVICLLTLCLSLLSYHLLFSRRRKIKQARLLEA